ncbi:MAG: GNAT family N-acetyltransferase [Halosimplex sp.]
MADLTVTTHESIDDVGANQWNTLVRQSDLGCVFHRHGWLRAIERGLDRRAHHLVVRKGGNPDGVFPNFWTTVDLPDPSEVVEHLPTDGLADRLPAGASALAERVPTGALVAAATDASAPAGVGADALERLPLERLTSTSPGFGGPVVLTDERESLSLLFDRLEESVSGATVSHVLKAKEPGFVRYGKFLAGRGYEPTRLDCRFELPVDRPFEELLADMDKSRRKAIRDGREQDYTVVDRPLADAVDETHAAYVRDIERAGGEPYPRSFFAALAAEVPERTRVFVLEVDGREVGRYVHVLDEEQSAVHYFFSAIGDTDYYQYNPTELLHAHAIEWARAEGYDVYDFGSTGSTFREGLFRYKEKYGARPLPTLRWERGGSPALWSAYRLARRRYQRLTYPDT